MLVHVRRAALFVVGLALVLVSRSSLGATTLILQKGRVEVSVTWRSQYNGTTGSGTAIPISDVFGFFAFTDPANPEVFVKVLDFGSSSPLLLFYGGLTDFEYHLAFHNRCTGQDVRLDKAPGTFDGGADNRSMLAGCATGPPVADTERSAVPRELVALRDDLARPPLAASPTLSLSRGRVEVSLTWKSQYDGSSGTSIATPINDNFGFLSFFDAANPEVFVKVLDFGSTSPLLLFYGGLTDFEYEVTYRNVCTSETVVVKKPAGSYSGGADNKTMFARCEAPPLPPHLAAVKSVEEKLSSILQGGGSQLDSVRAIAAYMATLPEYSATGVDEESRTAYGVLENGRVHVVVHNRVFDSPPAAARAEPGVSALAGAELPGSGYARLLQSFGGDREAQEPVNDIAAMLEDPGGYVVRSTAGDARLEVLRNVSGDGFFYFNTHAGRYYTTLDKTGPSFYSLQSSTFVTAASDKEPAIAADLAAGRLVYFTEVTGDLVYKVYSKYGINAEFVKAYWHFAPNSILFLNTCWSGKFVPGPLEFVAACWASGAGVVFGWDGLANSGSCYTAVRYFVDRLIGANKFMKESPPQRAFPWDLVYQDMLAKGLTNSLVTGAILVPRANPGGEVSLLDPSIRDMNVSEADQTLHLRGYFGSTKGKVSVGGTERDDCAWAKDEVVCPIDTGANGDVFAVVKGEAGRERKSNVRQLTRWDIPFTYKWLNHDDRDGLNLEGNGMLHYRADVGGYRTRPAGAATLTTRATWGTKDSSLTVTASGTHQESKDCKVTFSGTGKFLALPSLSDLGLVCPMKVDTISHAGAIGLAFGAPSAEAIPFKETRSGPALCSPGSEVLAPWFGTLDGLVDFTVNDETGGVGPVIITGINFTFGQDFTIPKTKSSTGIFGGTLSVEWTSDIQPMSPPKPDAAR